MYMLLVDLQNYRAEIDGHERNWSIYVKWTMKQKLAFDESTRKTIPAAYEIEKSAQKIGNFRLFEIGWWCCIWQSPQPMDRERVGANDEEKILLIYAVDFVALLTLRLSTIFAAAINLDTIL